MQFLIALVAGALFGAGLMISDMINPGRVMAFLNVASGAWDPTLAFVMAGAMVPMVVMWALAPRLGRPLAGECFPDAPRREVDAPLIGGSALFGLGWGLVGFCPGPALSALTLGGWPVLVFVAAMIAGMAIENLATGAPKTRPA